MRQATMRRVQLLMALFAMAVFLLPAAGVGAAGRYEYHLIAADPTSVDAGNGLTKNGDVEVAWVRAQNKYRVTAEIWYSDAASGEDLGVESGSTYVSARQVHQGATSREIVLDDTSVTLCAEEGSQGIPEGCRDGLNVSGTWTVRGDGDPIKLRCRKGERKTFSNWEDDNSTTASVRIGDWQYDVNNRDALVVVFWYRISKC